MVTGAEAASAILRLTCSKSGFDQPTLVVVIPLRAGHGEGSRVSVVLLQLVTCGA